jgi:hypothetical protein
MLYPQPTSPPTAEELEKAKEKKRGWDNFERELLGLPPLTDDKPSTLYRKDKI